MVASLSFAACGQDELSTGEVEQALISDLVISPVTNDFGAVAVGANSVNVTFTVTNTGSLRSGTLTRVVSGNDAANFVLGSGCTGKLAPAASCTFTARFSPTSAGVRFATITVAGSPGGSAAASVTGTGVPPASLTLSPTARDFGAVVVGTTSASTSFTVTNTGGVSSGTPTTTLSGAAFAISANTCTAALAPAASCVLTVNFSPPGTGIRTGTLTVKATPGGTVSAALSGSGLAAGAIAISPTVNDYGAVAVGGTSVSSFVVSNTGSTTIGVPTLTLGGTDAAAFAIVSNGCTVTLAAGTTCSISVSFAPVGVGVRTASLAVSASPGGNAVATLSGSGVPPASLSITPATQDFGNVVVGNLGPAVTFTIVNTGGVPSGFPLTTLSGADASSFLLSGNTCASPLAAGASCTVSMRFAPFATGARFAVLSVSASPGGSSAATVTGSGVSPAQLSITPSSHDFGGVTIGSIATGSFTVTNTGGAPSGSPSMAFSGTDGGDFSLVNNNCATVLAPGASCVFSARFSPTTAGGRSAVVTVFANPGGDVAAALTGTGQTPATLVISPVERDFGAVAVGGSSATFAIIVSNVGDQPSGPVVGALTGTDAAEFVIVSNDCNALAPSASCTLVLRLDPTGSGAQSATLQVSASPGGMVMSALTGTGVVPPPAAPTIAVSYLAGGNVVSWNSVPGATNYRVYRATTPGVTTSSLLVGSTTSTSLSNQSVTAGSAYYYRVVASSAAGDSALSNEVSISLPSDACHVPGTCDSSTGVCSNPPATDGTACDDGIECTVDESCHAGVCGSVKLAGIEISPSAANLVPGQSMQFTAVGYYESNPSQPVDLTSQVTWSTDNTAVLAVAGASITAQAIGQTRVVATLAGVSNFVNVRAWDAARLASQTGMAVTAPWNVSHGECVQLSAIATFNNDPSDVEDVTSTTLWSPGYLGGKIFQDGLFAIVGPSSDSYFWDTVAGSLRSANPTGRASAAVWGQRLSGTCSDPRSPGALWGIRTTPATATLQISEAVKVTAIGVYADGSARDLGDSVSFTTATPTVLSAAPDGHATGLALGAGKLVASEGEVCGITPITVIPTGSLTNVTRLAIEPPNANLALGAPYTFTVLASYASQPGRLFNVSGASSWTTTDSAVAASTNGAGIATSIGRTTFTASLGSVAISANVRVWDPVRLASVTSLSVSAPGYGACQQLRLRAVFNDDPNDTEDVTNTSTWRFLTPGPASQLSSTGLFCPAWVGGYWYMTASMGRGLLKPTPITLGVWSIDEAPVAVDDVVTMFKNSTAQLDVLANDTDVDGGSIAVVAVTQPAHGTAAITGGGISYTPALGFLGQDSFTYTLNGESSATVTLTVDDPPTAVDDPIVTTEDLVMDVSPLANDLNADGGAIYLDSVTQPANGTVTLVGGNVRYFPHADYFGADSFTYTLNGGSTGSVEVTVLPVNDAPSFTVGGNQLVTEDAGTQTVSNFITALSPGPGNELEQQLDFVVIPTQPTLFASAPSIDAATGALTYTLAHDQHGSSLVLVAIRDSGGVDNAGLDTSDFQAFEITVNAVNDAPSFLSGGDITVEEDTGGFSAPWATMVSAGPDNESGQVLAFTVSNDNAALFAVQPTIASDGTLSFTPAVNAGGSAAVSVTLSDSGGSDETFGPMTFTIVVTPVDDSPVAVADSVTVAQDSGPTTLHVLANDLDGDAGSMTIVNTTDSLRGGVVLTTNGGAELTYEPAPDYCNSQAGDAADSFTYTLSPGGSTTTVLVAVTCIPLFSAATSYGVGSIPRTLAVGDFSRDGKLDLAGANFRVLGDGAGGFGAPTNFGYVTGARSVGVADLNGDGALDLAIVNFGYNAVSVALGDGVGGFGGTTDYGQGPTDNPIAVAVGDLDADGKLDIILANFGSNNVTILRGDGAGGFGAGTNFAVGVTPYSIAVADFNGDGKLDLATANKNSHNVSVLLGDGAAGFAPATSFGAGTLPHSLTTNDFDRDGKLDLAVANYGSNTVSVLRGDGAGGFGPAASLGAGTNPISIVAGDFSGDGKLDLAVANQGSNNVSVIVGDGTGGFGTANHYGAGDSPEAVATGDFNADGKLDLAVVNSASIDVSILLGLVGPSATGNFDLPLETLGGSGMRTVAAGDLNRDAKLDLVGATFSELGTGDGGFRLLTHFGFDVGARSVAVGDLNRDGMLDLAIANFGWNSVGIRLGNSAGVLGPVTEVAEGTTEHPIAVAMAHFDRDGKLDLAVANFGTNDVTILRGNGAGSFDAGTNFAVGTTPHSVAVGDFNRDGKLDLATANKNSNNVSILLGDGAAGFGAATSFGVGALPQSLVAEDFNRDGALDLAVANYNSGTVSVLLGTGAGGFGPAAGFVSGTNPSSVVAGDFTGDGKIDLAVANAGSGNVSILKGTDSGSFGAASNHRAGASPTGLATGDFNGDGTLDLAVVNTDRPYVSILLNNDGPAGPVSWWTADGTTADSVGGRHATALPAGFTYEAGVSGQAFVFDGGQQGLRASSVGLPAGSADRTLEMWIRVDGVVSEQQFFGGYGPFGSFTSVYVLGAVSTTLFWSSWGPAVFGGYVGPSAAWRHVAVTNTGTQVKLYLDGVMTGQGDMAINTQTGPGREMLFGYGDDSRRFKGAIDQVRIYDRALSAAEIAAIVAGQGL